MDPRRRPRLTLIVAALAIALTGCGPGGTTAATDPDPTATGSTGTPGAGEQEQAPPSPEPPADDASARVPDILDFEATTVGGETFRGASVAGRPVLLWFWAPWCPTCRGQVPQVQRIAATHGSALTVLGVGSLDSAEAIADFAADVEEVTHLEDVDGDLYRRFGITEQSSFVLLDDAGDVVLQSGYGGSEELDAEVAAVVG